MFGISLTMVTPDDIEVSQGEDDITIVTVQDGEDTIIYSSDSLCYYCGEDTTGVVVADTFAGRVHGAMCERHIDELKFKSREIEVRYF